MSYTLNIRKNEYNNLDRKLKAKHIEEVNDIKQICSDIRKLTANNGAFNFNDCSKKVNDILDVLEKQMIPLMDKTFKDTEKSMETLLVTIENLDTIC